MPVNRESNGNVDIVRTSDGSPGVGLDELGVKRSTAVTLAGRGLAHGEQAGVVQGIPVGLLGDRVGRWDLFAGPSTGYRRDPRAATFPFARHSDRSRLRRLRLLESRKGREWTDSGGDAKSWQENLELRFFLSTLRDVTDLLWFVAHTRPRREKKLADYAQREGLNVVLPCYQSAHKYRGKAVSFEKPLFPSYVFFRLHPTARQKVYQSDHVANLLDVPNQVEFEQQLSAVLLALSTKLEIQLAPEIGKGKRVKIVAGPLRGVEGWVEERYGMSTVLLRVDFLSQAAAVKVEADCLELM